MLTLMITKLLVYPLSFVKWCANVHTDLIPTPCIVQQAIHIVCVYYTTWQHNHNIIEEVLSINSCTTVINILICHIILFCDTNHVKGAFLRQ